MKAERLSKGKLLVPIRAEGPGGVIGDALVEIDEDHPDYNQWADSLKHSADTSKFDENTSGRDVADGYEHRPNR